MGSFSKKLLEVHFTLRSGSFQDGADTKIVTGIPIKVHIEKTGPPDFCKSTIDVRGMSQKAMEDLSTLAFYPLYTTRNLVQIFVGDENGSLSLAFAGEITNATADFNGAPDVSFHVEATSGFLGSMKPQSPTSVKGSLPVADFIKMQADAVGYTFENKGVTTQLQNSIFSGSPVAQARQAASQIGAVLIIDDGCFRLFPADGGPQTGDAVLLTKETGMIGYPVLTNEGITVKSLYNAAYRLGGLVEIKSIVPKASGVWRIIKLTHELSAFDPKGTSWQSVMTTFYPSMSGAGGKI